MEVKKLSETVKISKDQVIYISHDYLSMGKLFSRWLPHLFTIEHNQHHVDDSKSHFAQFWCNRGEFFGQFITINETKVHRSSIGFKKQSTEWLEPVQSYTKRSQTQKFTRKFLASNIGDAFGLKFII